MCDQNHRSYGCFGGVMVHLMPLVLPFRYLLCYQWVSLRTDLDICLMNRVMGFLNQLDPVIWLTNFGIYKAHLQACGGGTDTPLCVVKRTFKKFVVLFPVLKDFQYI